MSELMTNLIAVFEEVIKIQDIYDNAIFENFPILSLGLSFLGIYAVLKGSKLLSNRHRP